MNNFHEIPSPKKPVAKFGALLVALGFQLS
jgi:hypothetical protein